MEFTEKIEKELVLEILLFFFTIGAISLIYRRNVLVTAIILLGWLLGVKFWHKEEDLYFFLMGAIVGPVGEIICINFGVWAYANPSFLGIPIWLPLGWGLSVMVIKRTAETIIRIREE